MQISKILLSLLVAGLILNSTVIPTKNIEPIATSCTDVCTIN